MNGLAKYYIGNSRNLTSLVKRYRIPSLDLIISSPPYFDMLDYEGMKDQIGFGTSNYEEYLQDVAGVFQQCYELANENATFWLIIDTIKKKGEIRPLPFDLHRKLQELYGETWNLKEVIIWDKEKNLPWNSKGRFKNQFEYILFFKKGQKYTFNIDRVREINDLKKWWLSFPERYNPSGKAPSNVWHYTTPIRGWGNGKQDHFCPIPFALAEKIISIASNKGDIVLDPFAGSGSAIALASNMGRKAYGIDISKEYKTRFLKEVVKGAENYWSRRIEELSYNTDAIKNFKSTNQKLRKLKVASQIIKHINATNLNSFIYLLINRSGARFDLYVVENGIRPITDLTDDALNSLIHQAKVQPNIITLNESEITERVSSIKLNKYSLDKFYSINGVVNRNNITISKVKYDYLFSNIYIKVK
ncbi:MAG: site-specific DNA-methyltransferase [Cytophagales bacterium]|nr:site-specific DNA-methyltransferase [Cytophagales bacterium]